MIRTWCRLRIIISGRRPLRLSDRLFQHNRTLRAILGLTLSYLLAGPAFAQEVSASLEAGLQALAQEIINKSVASDRDTIAILPFPNADKTCSVLSTYIVDELTLCLFLVKNSLRIIERSQLEALLSEIPLGEGGVLDPKTTQKLGSLSGVKALVVGTITATSDSIRVIARLIATDTGQTISVAAITIPKTKTVADLLAQSVTTGPTCGGTTARHPPVPPEPPGAGQPGTTMSGKIRVRLTGKEVVLSNCAYGELWCDVTAVLILENLSGIGFDAAVRTASSSIGACSGVERQGAWSGLGNNVRLAYGEENQNAVQHISEAAKVNATLLLKGCPRELFSQVTAVDFVSSLVVRSGSETFTIPLSASAIPVRNPPAPSNRQYAPAQQYPPARPYR